MSESEAIKLARRRLCFKLAEELDPGDDPYDIDEAAKLLEMTMPLTYVEAEVEIDELRTARPSKPSIIVEFKTAMGCKDFADALRVATALRTELAEAKQRVAELESKLAQSTNYVADDELYPHVVWFANGRTVSIASGGHLEIGMGGRLAAAKGDVSDEQ